MKKVYIVPHAHWDREWYLPLEQHRLRLIWLIDSLLELLEKDPDYHHFHLDGQSIILDDYLEVKPEKREILKKYIQCGRLSVGPWYVLQDEYLISDEANVRNLKIGLNESRRFGEPSMIGYFPDAFGNISQVPQILKGFGIDNAVFGRGINAVGFNNSIEDSVNVDEYPSELLWRSPDGSEVLGIFMANWYNNGMEIPGDSEKAIEFLNKAVENAAKISNSNVLLLMNGCDHQPVQTDLTDILERVSERIPDAEFVQGSLSAYIDDVKNDVESLKVYTGEMNSQYTEGWWTLTGTASSRIYLKQMNDRCQKILENYLEPIETLAFLNGKTYGREELVHAWKQLLKNHPHDSICGCSVDEVHDEMVTRFNKMQQFAEGMLKDDWDSLIGTKVVNNIMADEITFKVYNPVNWYRSDVIKIKIDMKEDDNLKNPLVVDKLGRVYPSKVKDLGRVFDYTLPKNAFRNVTYVHRYEVEVLVINLEPMSMTSYKIIDGDNEIEACNEVQVNERFLENEYLAVLIEKDGSLTLTDKETGQVYGGLNTFEDGGDIGNEYMFKAPEKDYYWASNIGEPYVECLRKDSLMTEYQIDYSISLPACSDKEASIREGEFLEGILSTRVKLLNGQRRVDISTTINNLWKDHRLRVNMPSGVKTEEHYAHGQYDVITRPNQPWDGWKNPSNCQKQRYFVAMDDGMKGLMIANKGLLEYEVVDSSIMALTLLRSVGELGDWGVFPTPGAQCLGETIVEYSIIPYSGNWCESKVFRKAYEFNLDSMAAQVMTEKELVGFPFKILDGPFIVTAVKASDLRDSIIVRLYSVDPESTGLTLQLDDTVDSCYLTNLNEERKSELIIKNGVVKMRVKPKEIITFEVELK